MAIIRRATGATNEVGIFIGNLSVRTGTRECRGHRQLDFRHATLATYVVRKIILSRADSGLSRRDCVVDLCRAADQTEHRGPSAERTQLYDDAVDGDSNGNREAPRHR